jgi:hypothetical protein
LPSFFKLLSKLCPIWCERTNKTQVENSTELESEVWSVEVASLNFCLFLSFSLFYTHSLTLSYSVSLYQPWIWHTKLILNLHKSNFQKKPNSFSHFHKFRQKRVVFFTDHCLDTMALNPLYFWLVGSQGSL